MPEVLIHWWYWIVLALVLGVIEILAPAFIFLWFALAALVLAVITLFAPTLDPSMMGLLWSTFSIGFTLAWFKLVKPRMKDKSLAGMSREQIIGKYGMLVEFNVERQQGIVRFITPILGSLEWNCTPHPSSKPIAVGDRVYIVDTNGNTLVVKSD